LEDPRHLLDLIKLVRPKAALFTTYTFSVSHFDAVFLPGLRSVRCQDIAVLVDADEAAGYFAYHAVPTNAQAIGAYRHHVLDLWRRTLRRRSQKDRTTWACMDRLAAEWLPPPHVLHPWPEDRLFVKTQGKSRMP